MNMKKIVASASALALTAAVAVGGTLAWLTANTNTITNTFTIGKVGIELYEKDYKTGGDTWLDASKNAQRQEFKLVPGEDVAKEVKAKVTAGSEKSIVYLKVTKGDTFGTYFENFAVDTNWKPLDGHENFYYQIVEAENAGKDIKIMDELQPIDSALTNGADLSGASLAFQVAAVQYEGLTSGTEVTDGFSKLPTEFKGA